MAVPIQTQLFNAFLGSAEGIHSIILPDIFSSGGSLNLTIDKYGRAKRILGYSKKNSSAVTTDTGASATRVRALFPYRKTSGGSTTRQLLGVFDDAANEWELWYSTDEGANWTFIADLGSGSINQIPDFAQLGDTLIITNGKIAPRSWDGTTLTTAGSTQSPTVTSAVGTTGVLTGNYKWKLVSINGSGVRKAGSAPSTALLLAAERGSLSWTADSDTNQVGYELYRTTGTGEVYYYVTTIDGRLTVSYTDNTEDLKILENRVLEEHGDPPPQSYFAEPHKQRIWYLRVDANPQRGYWSDPGDPDSVLTDSNFLEFQDAETRGDVITGAKGDYEGKLVVFQEGSIWTVSGTGEVIGNIVDWTRTRTNVQVGTVSHRTVARIPAGSKYTDQEGHPQITKIAALAYFTPLGDIRLFDGDNDVVISHPVKTLLGTFNYAQRAKAWAVVDVERAEVTWGFAAGSSGEPDKAVTWNYRWGVWYERGWAFSHAIQMDTSTDASILLAGEATLATGGFVYLLWDGHSFNGSDFTARWLTKTLFGVNEQGQPAMSHTKRFRWVDLLFETDQTVTLTVEWIEGNAPDTAAALGSFSFSPSTASLLSAGGDTVVSAGGDTLVVSSLSTNARCPLKDTTGDYYHDRGVRLRVYDNAQVGSWSLEAMQLAYQILPGLKRQPGA